MTSKPKQLTTGMAAELLGVDSKTVGRWIKEGKLPSFTTPGGHYRVDPADVDYVLRGGLKSNAPGGDGFPSRRKNS